MERFDHSARDLITILHPIDLARQFLPRLLMQVLHLHRARWIFQMQSISSVGFNWPKGFHEFWNRALDDLCEGWGRKLFKQLGHAD